MSEVLTQRRPMAGLDETIGRLGPSFFDERKDGYLLAELLRIIADHVEPHSLEEKQKEGVAQSKCVAPDQVRADADPGSTSGAERPAASSDCIIPRMSDATDKWAMAHVSRISGDFAAIEAGLLCGLGGDAAAAAVQPGKAHAAPCVEPPESRSDPGHKYGSKRTGVRLRPGLLRPRYMVTAIAAAGLAGMAVYIFDTPLLGGPDSAALSAGNIAETAQTPETAPSAGAAAPAFGPARAGNPLAEADAPTALAAAQRDDAPVTVPGEAETAPKVFEPAGAAGSSGAAASPLVASQPAQPVPAQATTQEQPPPAQQAGTAVDAAAVKPAAEPVKTSTAQKAKRTTSQGQTRHSVKNAKASPANQPAAGSAAAAQAKTDAPPAGAQPSVEARPAVNDPLALVQGALNSFASAAAKLFEPGQR